MDLSKLSITSSLGNTQECREKITDFVDLSDYKDLRLVAFTNSPLDLYIIHSLDGSIHGISQRYKLTAGSWRSERFELQMKYIAIQVINTSDVPNTNLVVSVNGIKRRDSILRPSDIPQDLKDKHEAEVKSRKSPFSKFVHFKSDNSSRKPTSRENHDSRIPEFIPDAAFLIGSKGNRVMFLPKGNPYELLMIGKDGYPTFIPIHDMIQIYLSLKENETDTMDTITHHN